MLMISMGETCDKAKAKAVFPLAVGPSRASALTGFSVTGIVLQKVEVDVH